MWRYSAGEWNYEGKVSYDAAAAEYARTISPRSTATYWFYYGGDAAHQAVGSRTLTVKTYPKVGRPVVRSSSRFRAGKTLTVWGRWYRKAPSKMRVVIDRKVGGKWRRYAVKSASVRKASSATGTYSAKLRLKKRGRWRVRVIPDYGPPSDACSQRRYFRVR